MNDSIGQRPNLYAVYKKIIYKGHFTLPLLCMKCATPAAPQATSGRMFSYCMRNNNKSPSYKISAATDMKTLFPVCLCCCFCLTFTRVCAACADMHHLPRTCVYRKHRPWLVSFRPVYTYKPVQAFATAIELLRCNVNSKLSFPNIVR